MMRGGVRMYVPPELFLGLGFFPQLRQVVTQRCKATLNLLRIVFPKPQAGLCPVLMDEKVIAAAVRPDHEVVLGPRPVVVPDAHVFGAFSSLLVLLDYRVRVCPDDD